jgi:TonB family protein
MTEPRPAPSGALFLACALACGAAWGQPAPQPSAAASAVERAQKESDRTMYWIRVLADKPAPVKAAPAVKPVALAAAPTAKPATEAREKVKAAPAPTPAATTTTAATNPAHAPLRVAQASPVQSPVGDAPEPSALSSSSADNTAASVATTAAPSPMEVAPAPAPEPDPGLVQIKSVPPDFPTSVVARVHKGNVEVKFEVEPGGTVVDASVVESSNARLNNAAVEAIRQWRFKPTPTSHTAMVNLVFDIDTEK